MSVWSRLFREKQAAASQASVILNQRQAAYPDRDYKNFSKEGFQKCVIAYRCVQMIATNVKTLELDVAIWRADGSKESIPGHPVLGLLARPNPLMSGSDLIEHMVAFYNIAGDSYLYGAKGTGREPMELWPMRPDMMAVIPGEKRIPVGYEYRDEHNKITRFPVDLVTGESEIMHWHSFNPLSESYGQSPLYAGGTHVDQFNETNNWNYSLLKNAATPSGALISKERLSDVQQERLKQKLKEKYEGSRNSGKPLVLHGGFDWKQFSFSPKDMDWMNSKHTSARDVALAFGVPPMLLAIPGDNTYSNYREARQAFWIETLIPMVDSMLKKLSFWLFPKYGAMDLFLDYDKDSLDALSPSREALWDRVNNATFLKLNEKRVAVGYESDDTPGADDIWMPAGLLPLSDMSDIRGDDAGADDEDIQANDNRGFDEGLWDVMTDAEDNAEIKTALNEAWGVKLVNLRNERQRLRAWRSAERLRVSHMRRMTRRLAGAFREESEAVLEAARGKVGFDAINAVEDAIDRNIPRMYEVVKRQNVDVMESFAERVYRSVKGHTRMIERKQITDAFTDNLLGWIADNSGKRIRTVGRNSKKKAQEIIQKIMLEAADEGLNNQDIAKSIESGLKDLYTTYEKTRSIRIARTETVSAANYASVAAAKDTGLDLKKRWAASADETRTRRSHTKASRKSAIPMDSQFEVDRKDGSVDHMDHPGDPNGSAENIINCRCTVLFEQENMP